MPSQDQDADVEPNFCTYHGDTNENADIPANDAANNAVTDDERGPNYGQPSHASPE